MIRATFANPTGELASGDSVRVRVDAGSPHPVLMVPETVVLSSSRSKFTYIVNGSDEIELRVVELGPTSDGWQVIESGLTPTDRVAATNLLRLRPGVKVKVQ
jgi:multidrug efflux pump subunit AcrA (membrane-fusion protein)